jgi:hypothetical protein
MSVVSSVQEEYIKSFSLTKRFFADLDAANAAANGGRSGGGRIGSSYSTMSLPRRMPVKKLVSAFNSQGRKLAIHNIKI